MKNKIKIILVVFVGAVLYFNIGWAIGTYYHKYVMFTQPETIVQAIAKGGFEFFEGNTLHPNIIKTQIIFMILWPAFLIALLISWVMVLISLIFFLTFCGGIAKLFGIG